MKLILIDNGFQRFVAFGTATQLREDRLPVSEVIEDDLGSTQLRFSRVFYPACVRFMAYAVFIGPTDRSRSQVEAEYGMFPLDADPETTRPSWDPYPFSAYP